MRELFLQAKAVAAELGPSTGIAAASAALVFLLFGWPWRAPRLRRTAVGGVLSASVGFLAGCWLLGVRPQCPPREDQDRLLLVLFPAPILLKLLAPFLHPELLHPSSDYGP